MTARELIQKIERTYPLEIAAPWDNAGLQAGRRQKEVKKVLLALDATQGVIGQAKTWGADFLLTHHPITMEKMRTVTSDSLSGRKFLELIQADICAYACHTNYDVAQMAQLAGNMMKLQNPEVLDITGFDARTNRPMGYGQVGSLVRPLTLRECCELVKTIFQLDHVRFFGDGDQLVQRIAICPGSGKSMIGPALRAKAQVLITGDIGHHEGIDAIDQGLAIVDAGHYGLEHIFVGQMERFLQSCTHGLQIVKAQAQSPFEAV